MRRAVDEQPDVGDTSLMRSLVLFGRKRARCVAMASAWLISGCCASGSGDAPSQTDAAPAMSAPVAIATPAPTAETLPENRPAPGAEVDGPATAASAERQIAGAAHILIAYKGAESAPKTVTRSKEDAKKRATEVSEKLRSDKAKFEELVKQYSDDPISKPADGRIGNFERNAMPAAFSDATFAMKVDTISDVVETPRGFHIIKRTK